MKVEDVLERGYFPQELPPAFTTASFSRAVASGSLPLPPKPLGTSAVRHNLARVGSLRRALAIPNPLSQHLLAAFVVDHWQPLQVAATTSAFSLSRPKPDVGKHRAIVPQHPFSEWPLARIRARPGKRYLLRADINRFYSSIYTHSVPWALHTKAVAKSRQNDLTLVGNVLDKLLRGGNDNQTVGIPIGPDTSLLVAEIILAAVDQSFGGSRLSSGARYLDDYEFAFDSLAQAEQALADLQGALAEFELALNPGKCVIEELPRPLEGAWVADLRNFQIADHGRKQGNDLISFFTKAFVTARQYPQDPVLKYAVGRAAAVKIAPSNLPVYQSLLLQTASGEAGTLRSVIDELAKYWSSAGSTETAAIGAVLSSIVAVHAPMAHGSEVAWSIWGGIVLGAALDSRAETAIGRMADPVVAILALDAQRRNLLSSRLDVSLWADTVARPEELMGSQWLLAYEAAVKGWLPSAGPAKCGASRPYFKALADSHVFFYDSAASGPVAKVEARPVSPVATTFLEYEPSEADWEGYEDSKVEDGDDDADEEEVLEGY